MRLPRQLPEQLAPLVDEFLATQPFPLDPFQIEAAQHLAEGRSVLVAAPTGTGKALDINTPVLTPTGWVRIGDINIGDEVIGVNGRPVRVVGVYPQGKCPAYRVTFNDDVAIVCDLDHLWAVNTRSRRHAKLPWRVLTLRQIMAEGLNDGEGKRHFVPLVEPVAFPRRESADEPQPLELVALRLRAGLTQRALAKLLGVSQSFVEFRETGRRPTTAEYQTAVLATLTEVGPRPPIDPYLLGLLLGEGSFANGIVRFTSSDEELVEAVSSLLPPDISMIRAASRPYDWILVSSQSRTRNLLVATLHSLGLMEHRSHEKFIPDTYKFAPISDRVALLQGILDTDGSIDARGIIEYTTVSQALAEDVAFLIRSLGGRTRIRQKTTTGRLAYRLIVTLPRGIAPFRLQRKVRRYTSTLRLVPTRAIASVEPAGEAEMVCIAVDEPDGLFVIDGFVVTHNTVVAEFAIFQARRDGLRAIYTAPIKALSNQKFRDLRAIHGESEVGLLTGDIVENPAAPIVVMTTEIYRNMLLEGARAARSATAAQQADELVAPARAGIPEAADAAELARRAAIDEELSGVGCVIFDELHYLSDPERGPVWEEAIIHSPAHVKFAGLSATVSNADELRRWIERVHGPMALVYHDERAVPLEHYFHFDGKLHLVQNAAGERVERFPGIGGEAKLARMLNRARRYDFGFDDEDEDNGGTSARPAEEELPKEHPAPEPGEVLAALRKANMLPCIYFLPGRRAVEAAAMSASGHLLVSAEQRGRLHEEVQAWVRSLPAEDQKLDQVQRLAALLPRGLGYHHAGLLPALKVMVETLFARGELRAVFATDTLALGINMPARSVVIGSMSKFDGQQMRLLTPNEYQQLTGRAGRRGKDDHGSAILLYSPWDNFESAFAALTASLLPVTSAFQVRYNTVLNLWRPGEIGLLRRAVAASLREFQRHDRRGRPRPEDEYALSGHKKRRNPAREQDLWLSRRAAAELNATVYVLRMLGYIGEDDELTIRGRLLRAIFHPAGMILVELSMAGALDDLGPPELAEVFSWFTYDSSDRSLRNFNTLSARLMQVRREVWRAQRLVQTLEYEEGVSLSPGIVESFHSVAFNWWRGATLESLLRRIDLAEGDLLVVLNQTIDLLQQVQGSVGQTLDARDLWTPRRGKARRQYREEDELRERLERLRPALAQAWQGMLRGSVALSRAIPSLATPPAEAAVQAALPLSMAEDEDAREVSQDRVEESAEEAEDEVQPS
jgi:ATP-dependent RNA helicase HelY